MDLPYLMWYSAGSKNKKIKKNNNRGASHYYKSKRSEIFFTFSVSTDKSGCQKQQNRQQRANFLFSVIHQCANMQIANIYTQTYILWSVHITITIICILCALATASLSSTDRQLIHTENDNNFLKILVVLLCETGSAPRQWSSILEVESRGSTAG